jgi:zinc transport system substrate-binding protein
MNKKKRIPRLCCIGTVILAMILTGCVRRQSPPAETKTEGGKLNVVTTLFPYYDFTRQIAGDHGQSKPEHCAGDAAGSQIQNTSGRLV